MPRLVPIAASETPALLALRRTLWQLAVLGIAIAAALACSARQFDALPTWCVLVPASALAMHYRQALANALLARRPAGVAQDPRRRISTQRPQARRAAGGRTVAKSRQGVRHAMG